MSLISPPATLSLSGLHWKQKLDDEYIGYIQSRPLRKLDLQCSCVTGQVFSKLLPLQNLTALTISHNIKLKDLGEISQLTKLAFLDLSHCIDINRAEFMKIAKLTNLTSLNLCSTGITNVQLERIATVKGLLFLDISYCHRMTIEGMSVVNRRLTNLTSLSIAGCINIQDTLSSIDQLTNLTSLNTSGCMPITAKGRLAIHRFTNLTYLDLTDTEIKATDLGELSKLTQLTSIKGI